MTAVLLRRTEAGDAATTAGDFSTFREEEEFEARLGRAPAIEVRLLAVPGATRPTWLKAGREEEEGS
jgi:hypothetical protein